MTHARLLAVPAALLALAGATAASAHARLVSTTPAANSGVGGTNRVALTFSERLLVPMSGGDVVMTGHPGTPHHAPMKIAGFKRSIARDGKTLELVAARPLAKGNYQVRWHAVTADTHRIAGAFAFQVR